MGSRIINLVGVVIRRALEAGPVESVGTRDADTY
jgi:hypothetical protein